MSEKTSLKVLIDGKPITLAGYEDEDYLQKVANYINRKISSFGVMPGYRRMASDVRNTLLALNIADDYFKAKQQVETIENSFETREQESYELKQDFVNAQIEIERLRKENDSLTREIEDLKEQLRHNGY